jgi:hypothetical protein
MPLKNHINHVVLVLDASSSMQRVSEALIRAVDAEIKNLARQSEEMEQETRITIYVFSYSSKVKCLIYDMDVLRLPSIRKLYRPEGMTALVDASLLAINDLAMTPEKYGDHAFLIYVFTDGIENNSRAHYSELSRRISALPDSWALGVFVPDAKGEREAAKYGFPPNNIAVWDATTGQGVDQAVSVVRSTTSRFMESRVGGGSWNSRSIFSTDASAVNSSTIQGAALKPLPYGSYQLIPVDREGSIREFVERCGHAYHVGMAHYQLTKPETIQPQKTLAVVDKATNEVFTGPQVRDLVGLPMMNVRVKPDFNPKYDIYVQSTSVNRKLIVGTKLLLMGV